jgi:hypothetical protein
MTEKTTLFASGRRQFLQRAFPAGVFLCLGGSQLLSFSPASLKSNFVSEKHKFLTDSGMSYQGVFRFAYQGGYIPTMKKMAEKIGKEKFIELFKESAAEAAAEMMAGMAKNFPKRDLAAFSLSMKNPDPVFKHALTFEIVEDSAKAFAVKIKECLWAKTFREADAADIGYAAICHGDFAMAKAFNPHIRMERTKTLMEGHDHCNHRWIWEA